MTSPLQALGKLAVCRRGATAVEFAILLPVFLLVLIAPMEFGRLLWTQAALHVAVEAAARCASVDTVQCSTSSAVQSFAASSGGGAAFDASIFTVSTPACGNQVAASYAFQFAVLPNLVALANNGTLTSTVTLTAQSCFPA
jgi:Flp pilus assembly protein TadG